MENWGSKWKKWEDKIESEFKMVNGGSQHEKLGQNGKAQFWISRKTLY